MRRVAQQEQQPGDLDLWPDPDSQVTDSGGTNLPRREVVLITDFQRLGWAVRDEISFPPGTTITNVDVTNGDTAVANAAVAAVNIQRSEGERDRATIAARLTNTGAAPVANVDATLDLNGRVAETKRVTIPAHGATQVRFASTALSFRR